MSHHDEESLNAAESHFQRALLASDVDALDQFLHVDARYLGPDGATVDKTADLDAHRSGALSLSTVDEIRREVQVVDTVGITRVHLHLVGRAGGQDFDAVLAYTRAWAPSDGGWRIVAAHGSAVPQPG